MLRYRVMANDLKLGTGVEQDNLSAEEAAKLLAKKQKGAAKFKRAYFIQEYEESRYNK